MATAIVINQPNAIRQSYQLVTVPSHTQWLAVSLQRNQPPPERGQTPKVVQLGWSRGSDLWLLRLTMDGLPDWHIWGATPCIRIVGVRRLDLTNLGPFAGKIGTFGEDPIFFVEVSSSRRWCGAGAYDSDR